MNLLLIAAGAFLFNTGSVSSGTWMTQRLIDPKTFVGPPETPKTFKQDCNTCTCTDRDCLGAICTLASCGIPHPYVFTEGMLTGGGH